MLEVVSENVRPRRAQQTGDFGFSAPWPRRVAKSRGRVDGEGAMESHKGVPLGSLSLRVLRNAGPVRLLTWAGRQKVVNVSVRFGSLGMCTIRVDGP